MHVREADSPPSGRRAGTRRAQFLVSGEMAERRDLAPQTAGEHCAAQSSLALQGVFWLQNVTFGIAANFARMAIICHSHAYHP